MEAVKTGGDNGVTPMNMGTNQLCNKVEMEGVDIIVIIIRRCKNSQQGPTILTVRATPPKKLVMIITVGAMATMWPIGITPERVQSRFKAMCGQPQDAIFVVYV